MSAPLDRLTDLRSEIDRIDLALAELIRERMGIVAEIGRVKRDSEDDMPALALRPAREAAILRRLIAASDGRIPPALLVRVWRELLGAATIAQTPFKIAVCAGPPLDALWDLARQHFGASVPAQRMDRPAQALRAIADGKAHLAVLPPPGDDVGWWEGLIDGEPRLRVVAKLPFLVEANAASDPPEAFVVAELNPEPSEDDLTLLVIEAATAVSRAGLRSMLADVGLQARWAAVRDGSGPERARHLVELEGFVTTDDKRCRALIRQRASEIERLVVIGAYARPVGA